MIYSPGIPPIQSVTWAHPRGCARFLLPEYYWFGSRKRLEWPDEALYTSIPPGPRCRAGPPILPVRSLPPGGYSRHGIRIRRPSAVQRPIARADEHNCIPIPVLRAGCHDSPVPVRTDSRDGAGLRAQHHGRSAGSRRGRLHHGLACASSRSHSDATAGCSHTRRSPGDDRPERRDDQRRWRRDTGLQRWAVHDGYRHRYKWVLRATPCHRGRRRWNDGSRQLPDYNYTDAGYNGRRCRAERGQRRLCRAGPLHACQFRHRD